MRENLIGKRYGDLTVTAYEGVRSGHGYWRCRCACGKETVAEASHLKNGHTKSCGCKRVSMAKQKALDLTGERYGRLTVIEPAYPLMDIYPRAAATKEAVPERSGYWRCRCDCGKEIICHIDNLRAGNTRSCGCLREEQRRENMKKAIHHVDGTCVERIACRRTFANNTSGHRGVYRCGEKRWRATIGFQGKVYHLGYFTTFEQAAAAREEAEKDIYDPFLRKFHDGLASYNGDSQGTGREQEI